MRQVGDLHNNNNNNNSNSNLYWTWQPRRMDYNRQ